MNKTRLISLLNIILVVLILTACGSSGTPRTSSPNPPASPGVSPSPIQELTPQKPESTRASPGGSPQATQTSTPLLTKTPVPEATGLTFASYPLKPVNAQPSLQQEAIDPQMGNVLVPLALSADQLRRLVGAGVVASPADYPEFHILYKETVQKNLPVFITSDALLHAYHLIFDQLLSSLEEQVFLNNLRQLNQALLAQTQAQYEQLKGTAWEDAALRTNAYLAVGSQLSDPEFEIPDFVSDLAQAELDLIKAANGPALSPIFPHLKYGEDYSQYLPRGHYTKSEALKAYFRVMMWFGRMTFRLSDPENPQAGPDETRMALLLALAVRDGRAGSEAAMDLWRVLYDPTAFLVGRSDDLTVEDYLKVMDEVYQPRAELLDVADESRLQAFIAATELLPAPRILGLVSDDYKPLEAVKGLRLMGQRFVPDAYIFQELIHPKVPNRFLPSGLDVMAVLGSARAATWLEQDAITQNSAYQQQFDRLTGWLADLSPDDWIETSYNAWLYALRPLLEPVGAGYPQFMQSTAWQDKQLNTALGSWAELKHDTILYAKQAYGGLGGCGWPAPPSPVPAQGYVEPVPEVFARIAALAEMTRQGLEARGLIQLLPKEEEYEPTFSDRLAAVAAKALEFKAMAERELQGQPLTVQEEASLRGFGGYLEEVVIWANGDKPEPDPAAIIADVATDPNKGEVLEVGIGNVHELYAVAPIPQADGSLALTVARGAIFSYYEFPSQKRLTDEAWRAMLKARQTPEQPAFITGFSVPQPSSPNIQTAIYRFQRDWANWLYWTVGYNGTEGCSVGPQFIVPVGAAVLRQAEAAVAALQAQGQYEGRQWISSDYLGVEPSPNSTRNVVVTVRETWSDYLVTYTGSDPFTWFDQNQPEPVAARRGPYTVDVSYELEPWVGDCAQSKPDLGCYYKWRVVSFMELTERPAWETP
ncbi:MAG TPA: DUF3160 domain-containing protein [Anaerolineales bacterium]|nr:DUF3160 domain-containing protein [Anaerolineales bacterium]